MKERNVLIPESLWRDLVDYHINDNLDVSDRIYTQINAKLRAQIRHQQYTEELKRKNTLT